MGAVVTVKRGGMGGLIVKEELLYRATSTGQNHDRTRQHIMQRDNAQVSILCKETIHTSAYYARRQYIRQHIMHGDNAFSRGQCCWFLLALPNDGLGKGEKGNQQIHCLSKPSNK